MRRTLLSILISLCLMLPCAAQDPNPQGGFVPTVLLANPSTYLNFNDQTTAFKDTVSGLSFVGTFNGTAPNVVFGTIGSPTTLGYVVVNAAPMVAGSLASVTVQFQTNPPVGSLTIVIGSVSGSTFTLSSSFTVTVASTTAAQTFMGGGVDFPTTTVTAGQLICSWMPSSASSTAQAAVLYPGPPSGGRYYCSAPSSVPGSCSVTHDATTGIAVLGNVSTSISSGTITPRQPGFDSTLLNNTSAEFPWNGWSAAPNNTLGTIEWNMPWSMMVQVDRLNWNRTGTLVLASKGDLVNGNYWKLYLQTTANTTGGANGQVSQLCFSRHSSATAPNIYSGGVTAGICTAPYLEAMPNGFNYNIIVTDSGTGNAGVYGYGGGTPALDIYINGLDGSTALPETPFTGSYQYGFGDVGIAYSGGTGYANPTAFTSSGGGANCNFSGSVSASSGVPNGISYTTNYGCTSVPTITLTSPTGTGVTLTPSLSNASMNSTSYPLMVPGYVSGGVYYGVAGTTSSQTPTYIDEFAIFPVSLNHTQIADLFYWTRFYQTLWNIHSANRVAFLLATDGCSDVANPEGTQLAIDLHTLGIIKLEGVISSGDSSNDRYDDSASFWRQMLDQAGLSNVPVGNLYTGTNFDRNYCLQANLNAYNASTPQTSAGFPTSAAVARTVMARNPTTPVLIYNGPAPYNNWLADFMQSPADSISPLTGQQLWDQDVANGGAMWWQGPPSCSTSSYPSMTPCSGSWTTGDPTASQYVFSHLDGMPTYQVIGTPQSMGQDIGYTRNAKDPMFMICAFYGGSCTRAAWGQYGITQLFTSYFTNGVAVGYSGGTGYANLTPFTSMGGGTNCVVNGIMTASGGVPNGIETSWGAPQPLKSSDGIYVGLGSGCTSIPTLVLTSPTGTGVTLTAYPMTVCGTGTVSGSTYSFSSATCSNQYVVPFTEWANGGAPLIYNWFLNSLSDPPTNGRPRFAQ